MGHVPAGPVPQAGPGDDVPRRQHRRGRAPRAVAARRLGHLGERLAARLLTDRGARIGARNLRVGDDEVDLLVVVDGVVAAVEVKTRVGVDPIEEFTPAQAAHLRRAAAALGVARCDLVTVRIDSFGAAIRWIPEVC